MDKLLEEVGYVNRNVYSMNDSVVLPNTVVKGYLPFSLMRYVTDWFRPILVMDCRRTYSDKSFEFTSPDAGIC
jgi:hypothetical protein